MNQPELDMQRSAALRSFSGFPAWDVLAVARTRLPETLRWWGTGRHRSTAFAALPADPLPITEQLSDSSVGVPYFANVADDEVGWLAVATVAEE